MVVLMAVLGTVAEKVLVVLELFLEALLQVVLVALLEVVLGALFEAVLKTIDF